VTKDEVADLLEPGTRAAFDEFSRCADCARVYWRGAHADSLDAMVSGAGNRRDVSGVELSLSVKR
jgi:uncharacterized protein with PIN domain